MHTVFGTASIIDKEDAMRIITLAFLLVVLSAGVATADDPKEIRATYDKFCAAIVRQNIPAIRALETPDFTADLDGRKGNAKQAEADMKQQFSTPGRVRFMRVVLRTVSIRGKTADVKTDFWYQAETTLKSPSGKPHIRDRAGSIANTLIKTAGGWKFKTMMQKTLSVAVDGQRINPAKGGSGMR